MKKILLLISVLLITTPVQAQVPGLTIEEATRKAVRNSSAIRNFEDQIALTEQGDQRVRDAFWGGFGGFSEQQFLNMQTSLLASEAARAVSLAGIDAQRESLNLLITSQFNAIIAAENQLSLFDEDLRLLERNAYIRAVMLELGLASPAEYNNIRADLQATLHRRNTLESDITAGFRELNRLMGTPVDNRYSLIFEPMFEPLPQVNLPGIIREHKRDGVSAINAREQVRMAQFDLDNHRALVDPFTGAINPGGPTRVEREIALEQAQRNLEDVLLSIENGVTDTYTAIRNMEISIISLGLDIETLRVHQEISEVQYYVGFITSLELETIRHNLANLENALANLKAGHSVNVMRLFNSRLS